jgi:hypothetical protein
VAKVKTIVRNGVTLLLAKQVNGVTQLSCECCDDGTPSVEECCMYPAKDLLVGGEYSYTEDDLPDSVRVVTQNTDRIYTRDGQHFVYEDESVPVDERRILSLRPIWNGVDGRWARFVDDVEVGNRRQPCLIAPNEPLMKVFDQFADFYTVTKINPDNSVEDSAVLQRESLCRWSFNDCWYLTYFNFINRWIAGDDCDEWVAYKDGFHNTPLGTYPDAWALQEGARIEVTAA